MTPPRLLVIDDEAAVREIVCEFLSLLGCDVETADCAKIGWRRDG